MKQIPSISDALRTVVQAVDVAVQADTSINYGNGLAKRVYFEHGTDDDIIKLLAEYTKSNAAKYPLVALVRRPQISQSVIEDGSGYRTDATIRILVCTITKAEFRPNDRETNSFKKILHPIVSHLLYQLSISPVFGQPTIDQMKITFSDNYSWGKQKLVEVGDFIDAVDISRMSISVRDTSCINQFIQH